MLTWELERAENCAHAEINSWGAHLLGVTIHSWLHYHLREGKLEGESIAWVGTEALSNPGPLGSSSLHHQVKATWDRRREVPALSATLWVCFILITYTVNFWANITLDGLGLSSCSTLRHISMWCHVSSWETGLPCHFLLQFLIDLIVGSLSHSSWVSIVLCFPLNYFFIILDNFICVFDHK